jgi:hypothetical protein
VTRPVHLSAAANTLAPALAILRKLGYTVSRIEKPGGTVGYKAEGVAGVLYGEDTLQLLALATIVQHRGEKWQPSDQEVKDVLRLDGVQDG